MRGEAAVNADPGTFQVEVDSNAAIMHPQELNADIMHPQVVENGKLDSTAAVHPRATEMVKLDSMSEQGEVNAKAVSMHPQAQVEEAAVNSDPGTFQVEVDSNAAIMHPQVDENGKFHSTSRHASPEKTALLQRAAKSDAESKVLTDSRDLLEEEVESEVRATKVCGANEFCCFCPKDKKYDCMESCTGSCGDGTRKWGEVGRNDCKRR